MTDKKPALPDENKPAPESAPENFFDTKSPWGPFFWFLLLFIPAILALAYGAGSAPSGPQETRAARIAEMKNIEAAQRPENGRRQPSQVVSSVSEPPQQPPSCDYQDWLGQMLEDSMIAKLKADKRAYRLSKPGSAMTMDYNPARVNLDLNNQGLIIKVWCG